MSSMQDFLEFWKSGDFVLVHLEAMILKEIHTYDKSLIQQICF